jgi:hypothetical protein
MMVDLAGLGWTWLDLGGLRASGLQLWMTNPAPSQSADAAAAGLINRDLEATQGPKDCVLDGYSHFILHSSFFYLLSRFWFLDLRSIYSRGGK